MFLADNYKCRETQEAQLLCVIQIQWEIVATIKIYIPRKNCSLAL